MGLNSGFKGLIGISNIFSPADNFTYQIPNTVSEQLQSDLAQFMQLFQRYNLKSILVICHQDVDLEVH